MMIESLFQDVRYALRGFRKSPLFAAGVVGTIGLGLGLRVLGVHRGERVSLEAVRSAGRARAARVELGFSAVRWHKFSIDDWTAIRAETDRLHRRRWVRGDTDCADDGVVYGQIVTGNYFATLGVRPFLGRLFEAEDAAQPGARAVAVLSHSAWLARFGADPSIVGRDIRLGRQSVHRRRHRPTGLLGVRRRADQFLGPGDDGRGVPDGRSVFARAAGDADRCWRGSAAA